jgi:hypothetical protein
MSSPDEPLLRAPTFDEELLTHDSVVCARLGDEPAEIRAADADRIRGPQHWARS